jgi:hypothetical protein
LEEGGALSNGSSLDVRRKALVSARQTASGSQSNLKRGEREKSTLLRIHSYKGDHKGQVGGKFLA